MAAGTWALENQALKMKGETRPVDITDHREITFHSDALLRAIRSDPSTRPDTLPTGVAFVPSSNSVKVIYGEGQAAQNAVLPAEEVATLLVSHCMRIGVPVPRHAGKEVQVLDDHVCLSFSTSIDPVPLDPRPLPRSTKATGSRSWFPEEHFP